MTWSKDVPSESVSKKSKGSATRNNQQSRPSGTPHNGGSGSKTGRKSLQNDHAENTSLQPKTQEETGQMVTPPKSSTRMRDNLEFYSNKLPAKPSGKTIEEMLRWKGDYRRLESCFPIPEGGGVNRFAQPLQVHEALAIKSDDTMINRLRKAYKMMLDFYGMELARADGSIRRCNTNWKDRYAHLNRSRHNYLRITRIIKSLGCLGYERFQLPWVEFLIEEAFGEYGELPGVRSSVFYWVYAINDVTAQDKICNQLARQGIYGPEGGLCYEPEPDYDSEEESDDGEASQTEYGATGIGQMEAQFERSKSSKISQKSQPSQNGERDTVKETTI